MNNRSLIGRFKETLSWVASKSGKTFLIYDEEGTTRTCHCCDYRVEGGLSSHILEWECPVCRAIHVRDENFCIKWLEESLARLTQKKAKWCFRQYLVLSLVSLEERWVWRVLLKWCIVCAAGAKQRKNFRSGRKLKRRDDTF